MLATINLFKRWRSSSVSLGWNISAGHAPSHQACDSVVCSVSFLAGCATYKQCIAPLRLSMQQSWCNRINCWISNNKLLSKLSHCMSGVAKWLLVWNGAVGASLPDIVAETARRQTIEHIVLTAMANGTGLFDIRVEATFSECLVATTSICGGICCFSRLHRL